MGDLLVKFNEINSQQECSCPSCHADWHAGLIPQDMIDNGMYDPLCKCGEPNRWKRSAVMFSVDDQKVVAVICPDCKEEFVQ